MGNMSSSLVFYALSAYASKTGIGIYVCLCDLVSDCLLATDLLDNC